MDPTLIIVKIYFPRHTRTSIKTAPFNFGRVHEHGQPEPPRDLTRLVRFGVVEPAADYGPALDRRLVAEEVTAGPLAAIENGLSAGVRHDLGVRVEALIATLGADQEPPPNRVEGVDPLITVLCHP